MAIIIYPPIIDWDYMRQRPQQLMLQFARHNHLVLYFDKYLKEGPIYTKVAENLYVIHHPKFFNEYIYPLCASLGKKVYWSSWSKKIPFHSMFDADVSVYDCVDDFPDWEGEEKEYCSMCDVIVCTADKLENKMRAYFPEKRIYKVPNGCEWDYFSQHLTKNMTVPSETMRIGYIGAWAPWVDAEIVRSLSAEFPLAEIKILGPDLRGDTATFDQNVHFYGHIPYEELLDHLSYIDVLILPFANNRITQSTNPIKIYEYLATGKPVVSTNLPEVQKMSSAVFVSNNIKDFIEKIKYAYATRDKNREMRSNYARNHSWQERYKQIEGILMNENIESNPKESIRLEDLVGKYDLRTVELDYCTVNSYYAENNLSKDPVFVGSQGGFEYQCYFKAKYLPNYQYVAKVYLELTMVESEEEFDINLSIPTKPWYRHNLTFANKPRVDFLSKEVFGTTFTNAITIDVTPYIHQGQVPMFHLSSSTQKLLRFTEPRLIYVQKRVVGGNQ